MLVASTVAFAWAIPASAADTPTLEPSLESGIAAYRAGDYTLARDRFLQTLTQAEDSEELRFNLALSYYKLGDYPLAQSVFNSLLASPTLGAVAEYHLGLVAAQNGLTEQAAEHWRAAQAATDSPELRQLAEFALQRLASTAVPSKFSASATLGAGFDSNRTQFSDRSFDGVSVSDVDAEAGYTELSAGARYLADDPYDTELRGGLYVRDYMPDRELDQYSAQFSLRRSLVVSNWQYGAALEAESVWLGGDHFQNAAGLNLDALRSVGASSFSLRYRPSFIAAASGYDYLDGSSQRFEFGYSFTTSRYRLRLQYDAEFNDRRDLELGSEFFSQSAMRHGLGVRLTQRVTSALSLDWSARYRYSRYRDPNRTNTGFEIIQQRRVDELAQAGVTAALTLARNWGLRLEYRYTDNRSRDDLYDYDRHDLMLGLDWVY